MLPKAWLVEVARAESYRPAMPATPLSRAQALAWLIAQLPILQAERIPLAAAHGRLLAETIPSLPHNFIAAIDGHAVRAAATDGASDYAPLPVHSTSILAGHKLPPGTDAILPLDALDHGAALAPIPPGHGLATPTTRPRSMPEPTSLRSISPSSLREGTPPPSSSAVRESRSASPAQNPDTTP